MKAAVSVLLSEVVRELFTGKELRKNSRISPERIDFSPNRTIVYTTQQAWVAQWIERGFPKPCSRRFDPLPGTSLFFSSFTLRFFAFGTRQMCPTRTPTRTHCVRETGGKDEGCGLLSSAGWRNLLLPDQNPAKTAVCLQQKATKTFTANKKNGN